MLLGQHFEVGWPHEAETPLVRSGAAPRTSGLEVIRALPSVLDAEDRAQILHPRVERAGPAGPTPLVRIEGIAKVVVVLVALASELGRVAVVMMDRPEPPRPVGVQVQL